MSSGPCADDGDTAPAAAAGPGRLPEYWVLLCAHGEAASNRFREHYAVSHRTLTHAAEVMPLPAPLRVAICTAGALRKRLSGRGGSRHNDLTRAQARALAAALTDDPQARYEVKAVFSSADPGVAAILAEAPAGTRILLQSMIPTDSRLSCGLQCRAAHGAGAGLTVQPLARLWEDPALVAVHREHLARQLRAGEAGAAAAEGVLLIVLHGTLLADKAGRPPAFHSGAQEKARYADALRDALEAMPVRPWERVEVAYLNHAVGGRWSQPAFEERLGQLAAEGVQALWVYPAEHLVESAETARIAVTLADAPLQHSRLLPCLNDSPLLIDYLAARVRDTVARGTGQPCGHCTLETPPHS
jgi:ferrochelatase